MAEQPINYQHQGRLVVKPLIYHQLDNEQPTLAELPTVVRQLTSDEQPWSRDFKVAQEWKPLRGCWLLEEDKPTSLLILTNREGKFTQIVPSPEEVRQAGELVVEVMLAKPVQDKSLERGTRPLDSFEMGEEHFTVHRPLLLVPGGLLVLEPSDLAGVHLRCQAGQARCTAWVYPG